MYQSEEMQVYYKQLYAQAKENLYITDLLVNQKAILVNGGLYTDNLVLYKEIHNYFSSKECDWWGRQSSFSLKDMFPERYKNQKELLLKGFIPLFKDNPPDLFDFACADGEWTYILAEYAKHIDGYEYSQKMVDMANMKYLHGDMGERLSFSQADIFNFQVEKIYDGGACLGLLTYLSENEHVAVEKLWKMIKPNGYLVTKDTLNISYEYPLYHYNTNNGYSATYHDIENYAKFFIDAGFKLRYDVVLDKVRQEEISFISWGAIWEKTA